MDEYREIEHHFDAKNIERDIQYVKNIIGRNINKIEINGLDKLKSIHNSQKIYLPQHFSNFDPVLIPLVLYENNFDIPLSAAGDHLTRIPFFGEWLKKRGAFVVKRKPCREDIKLFFNYLDNLITEEKKDILFFPGFTDRSKILNGTNKSSCICL